MCGRKQNQSGQTNSFSVQQQQTYKERAHEHTSFYNSLKEKKLTRNNLTKEVKNLYNENLKLLRKKIKTLENEKIFMLID